MFSRYVFKYTANFVFQVGSPTKKVRLPNRFAYQVSFSAWVDAPIALRRIRPMERLSQEFFKITPVNVAAGVNRQYKGLILPQNAQFEKLEARHTLLAGQFPLTSSVQRVADLKRGQEVEIRLASDGLVVSTRGIAQERAYFHSQIKVLTKGSKRMLTGKLRPEGYVEVHL